MRRLFSRRTLLGVLLAAGIAAGFILYGNRPNAGQAADTTAPNKEAVQRAHDTVKMLDDLHKGYVVHITATYVKAQERTPAAHVAKKIFLHMEKNGWAPVRLIDATGSPIKKDNVAKSPFEKRAIKKLNGGESYYSEVATKDNQSVLRAATRVPVVMKQCITCHPGNKEGELLGALVYEVPIK
ncbi:MAG TPA: DUF3365 domain-containing protein [Gemmataceae bacterium]|nr:DUF3365 domain-containing protein [Gemmataceae bacterium]